VYWRDICKKGQYYARVPNTKRTTIALAQQSHKNGQYRALSALTKMAIVVFVIIFCAALD
jgi:hypothetical protein